MFLRCHKDDGIAKPPFGLRQCGVGAMKHMDSQSKVSSVEFPDDIILSIFNRLPLRSLCRFMCVSKSWGSLIIHHFTSQQPRRPIFGTLSCCCPIYVYPPPDPLPNLLMCSIETSAHGDGDGILTYTSTPMPDFDVNFSWVRYCNGLFCYPQKPDARLAEGMAKTGPQHPDVRLAVWDSLSTTSTTPIIHFLPETQFSQDPVSLNFDLGFDPLSHTYKVLVWTKYPHCEIYPLIPNSNSHWRSLTDTTHGGMTGIYLDNVCIYNHTMLYWYTVADYIVSFDFSHESFGTIPYPHGANQTSLRWLSELDACLCLMSCSPISCDTMDFWMLKDNNAWVMMATLLSPVPSNSITPVHPLISPRTGEFLFVASQNVVNDSLLTLYLYNFFTRRYYAIQVNGLDPRQFTFISK